MANTSVSRNLWVLPIACATILPLWSVDAHATGVEIVTYDDPMSGVVCVTIDHDCSDPSAVSLDLDATNLITYDAAELGDPAASVPVAPCFDTTAFADDEYTLAVSSTCPGGTTSDSLTIEIDNPTFKLGGYGTRAFEHNTGALVKLDIEAGVAGLDVSVDFGDVDSAYTTGAETVIDNSDGTYTINYTLSTGNTRPIGLYSVEVELYDGTDERVHVLPEVIRYAPNPTPRVALVGDLADKIVYKDPPTGVSGKFALLSSSLSTSTIEMGDEVVLDMEVWTYAALDDDTLILRISEDGGDGYIKAIVPALNGSCGMAGCFYDVEATLALRPFAGDTVPSTGAIVDLEIGFSGAFEGPIVDGPPIPGPPAWYKPTFLGDYAVIGTLKYSRVVDMVSNGNHELAPQYAQIAIMAPDTAVVHQDLVLVDGCDHEHLGRTHSDGSFAIIYDLDCQFVPEDAQMYFRGSSTSGYFNVVVGNLDGVTYQEPFGEPFADDNLSLVQAFVPNDADEWGVLSITQQAIRMQSKTWELLIGNSPNAMPQLPVRWEHDVCDNAAYGTFYNHVYVGLCGAGVDYDPQHMDEWAMTHEFFHWFQAKFMVDIDGNGPGGTDETSGFGEGFATMMSTYLTGHQYKIGKVGLTLEAEDFDFNGDLKTDSNGGLKEATLPWKLYDTDAGGYGDGGSGGWSWRILWDFYDQDPGADVEEPVSSFATEWNNPSFDCETYPVGDATNCPRVNKGDFDSVGSPTVFRDVIVNYLGGGAIEGNLPLDPNSAFYYQDRGMPTENTVAEYGIGMTEFLDGALCRSNWHTEAEVDLLVSNVMAFMAYDPNTAPVNCP